MSASHSNLGNFEIAGPGMYLQQPANFYTSMAGTTSNPNAPQMVLNPYDPPTKAFYQAFNSGLLNPYQNSPLILPRAYYTINTAYGPAPVHSQIQRTCAGLLQRPAGM